ncbi:hypothetical protein [Vibrio mytili]|uniref:DNA polymerase III subunit beta n=1 Tax=Vibrio mytili TaxID=50718 RepID=A0A0C3I314_9VIBR|nr:hypothetical protein [Vibrio mytili]KIN09450.1 DNA polymerase III subunit beta [Vibrio mytili]
MKRLAPVVFSVAVLAGCGSTPEVNWLQNSQVIINRVNVELNSYLWVNLMPTVGEEQQQSIHGSLALQSDQQLPANLTVESLILKQGHSEWTLNATDLDTRTHSENEWEVVFTSDIEINTERYVDLAVLLDDAGKKRWLVEKSVKVNKVY